eukprot:2756960-Karenia_brevis.AAC.1
MFRLMRNAEQDAGKVSTQKDEQSVTAKTKSATEFQRVSRDQKKTNLWIKFAITLSSLLLYVYGKRQPKGIGQTA